MFIMPIPIFFEPKKSKEEIKEEIEISNELHYLELKSKIEKEMNSFKESHKYFLEQHYRKPITKITTKELLEFGFNSENLTKKHLCEILGDKE